MSTDSTPFYLFPSIVDSSFDTIQANLTGKILYDQPTVFTRLRVHEHATHLVTNCVESLKADFADDIALLKELAVQASKKLPEDLEEEEKEEAINDPENDIRSSNPGSADIYPSLVRLLNHITQFGQSSAPRKFERTNGIIEAEEYPIFGFPSASPDFIISLESVDASSKKWRDCDAFGKVKPSIHQGPMPTIPGTITPIVAQCADYARLFMSSRPFMLFCVGILIFGTGFCVGIFDCDGVTFSPIYDMFEDTDVFVRVVRSLVCELSIEELGLDPTVQVLTEETKALTNQCAKNVYPSALVSCGGSQWCTIGTPIWCSPSFLGRCTSIWRVRECVRDNNQPPRLRGDIMIMKTAWRSSARTPESDIYMSIPDPYPKGVAQFKCGGDVEFPLTGLPITVWNLRNKDRQNLSPETLTGILHRLILLTIGRPMWEYVSEYDLLTGFRDAIRGHKALCDMGILHHDISAGNVLLTESHNGGFITDLDLARIQASTIQRPPVVSFNPLSSMESTQRTHTTIESTVKAKRGACMSGTAQFMAMDILLQRGVVHEATHDVESFIWVFSYCVMRNILTRAFEDPRSEVREQCTEFLEIFSSAFAQTAFGKIAMVGHQNCDALRFPEDPDVNKIIDNFMSQSLVNLFLDFRELMYALEKPGGGVPLTHEKLLLVVDKTIDSL